MNNPFSPGSFGNLLFVCRCAWARLIEDEFKLKYPNYYFPEVTFYYLAVQVLKKPMGTRGSYEIVDEFMERRLNDKFNNQLDEIINED